MGLTPRTEDELAALLADASRAGRILTPAGGMTRSRCGRVVDPGEHISTSSLTGVTEHIPAELTVTVRAGTPLADLDAALRERGQWWPHADGAPGSTVGGALAAAGSGWRRLRYGPVRDSVLEVVLVTGDGRVVRGGGPTVKGVAGYDLPRLAVGSRGTLGVLTRATLKLTPLPDTLTWYRRDRDPSDDLDGIADLLNDPRRPTSIIVAPRQMFVEIASVEGDGGAPGGFSATDAPAEMRGVAILDVGVPPGTVLRLTADLDALGLDYRAGAGVGVCRVAVDQPGTVAIVRRIAASYGGHAVVADAPEEFREDPWGVPPDGVGIMDRMRRAFDPAQILSPQHRVGG